MQMHPIDLSHDLSGHVLIATPLISDFAFQKSVLLVCAHSKGGAVGVVLNRPASDMTLRRLFVENDFQPPPAPLGTPIYAGGPAGIDGVVALHPPIHPVHPKGVAVTGGLSLTPGLGVLRRLAEQDMLKRSFIALGHCAWGPKQIEAEIARNMWLTTPVEDGHLFGTSSQDRWDYAMQTMRVTPSRMSGAFGYA